MQHEDKLHWFDLIRGVAALLVFLGHLRSFTFTDYQANANLGLIASGFYFITGFGHQAVVIFFVLSGFFIIRSIHESVLQQRWNPGMYLFNRLSRLWVVLIPALLATLCWDSLGITLFPNAEGYTGSIPTLMGADPHGKLGWDSFLGNSFFLQTILVSTYGSNGALWSLANEFWYYLVFPLFYFTIDSMYHWGLRLLLICTIVLLYFFLGTGIMSGFLIWLMGGLVYLAFKRQWKIPNHFLFRTVSLLAFLGVLLCIRTNVNPQVFNDYSLSVVTAGLLMGLSAASLPGQPLQKLAVSLSEISYSVYLFHMPLAAFLAAALVPIRQAYSVTHMLLYLGLMAAILVYCFVTYYLFERNTNRLKKIALAFLRPRKAL